MIWYCVWTSTNKATLWSNLRFSDKTMRVIRCRVLAVLNEVGIMSWCDTIACTRWRIQFKLLTLMHGAVHAHNPRYFVDRVSAYVPRRSLRSADQPLLDVPGVNLQWFGRRAFSCASPSHWNSLPLTLQMERDSGHFMQGLNTFFTSSLFVSLVINDALL